jgi:hypothetical protein
MSNCRKIGVLRGRHTLAVPPVVGVMS